MPDVGTLNIEIKSNAGSAAEDLGKLAGALSKVQKAAAGITGLGDVASTVKKIKDAVSGIANLEGVKKITDLGKAIKSLSDASNMKSMKFDTKGITELKKAVGDGLRLGQAGTQLKNIRAAMEGFSGGGTDMSGTNGFISAIRELKTELGSGESGLAGTIKEVADAMRDYSDASKSISESEKSYKQVTEAVKENVNAQKEVVKESTGGLKLNLQMFGGKADSVSTGSWRDQMAGIENVNKAVKETDVSSINNIKELEQTLKELSKVSGGENIRVFAEGLKAIFSVTNRAGNSYRTLGYLATSIEKLKRACHGFKLPDFSRLENLARTLQENFNAENGLKRIADGMEAIKKANEGFKMPSSSSLEKIMKATSGSAGKSNASDNPVSQISESAKEATEFMVTLDGEVQSAMDNVTGSVTEIPRLMAGSLADLPKLMAGNMSDMPRLMTGSMEEIPRLMAGSMADVPKLMEGAMEPVKESVSEIPKLMAGDEVPKLLSGSVDGKEVSTAIITIGEQTKDLIVYNDVYVDSWENLCRVAAEAKQRMKEAKEAAKPDGFGTGRISDDIYAATDMRENAIGPALRGKEGYAAKMNARRILEQGTGLSGGEVNRQLEDLANKAREARKNVEDLIGSLNNPTQGNMNWAQGIDRMLGIGAETKSAAESASAFLQNMNETGDIAEQVRELNPELAETAEKFQDAEEAEKAYTQAAKDAANETKGTKKELDNMKKAVSGGWLSKLAHQFVNIAKRMAIRAIIKQVTSAFGEGVENVYRYNEAIGGSFATDMDSAATSLLQMKNAIGAAVAPAIQMLIPVVQQLVSWFITAVNYVNQFLALLNGQSTWTRALPYATKAFDDQKKKAKGASDAMKDLLADWDELNIIQSQGGGSGSGSSSVAEDYSKMFEEVSTFDSTVKDIAGVVKNVIDFVKDNLIEVVSAIALAVVGLKKLKFAKSATDALDKIAGFVSAGAVVALTVMISTLFDKAYADTGKDGWLIADVLTTALGAGIAGKIMSGVLGQGFGLITAGLTFAFSAGATFAVAEGIDDQAKKSKLDILGFAKLGISAILAGAGIHAAGLGAVAAGAGGILITGVAAAIMFSIEFDAEQKKTAAEMAKAAFASVGEDGAKIKPGEYLAALQTELDALTANYKLVVDAYLEVPDLTNKYNTAVEQLKGLNSVIVGSDSISEEDAAAFKAAWEAVMGALDDMNEKTYDTILAGLNASLATAVGEAKTHLIELRTLFIQEEKELDKESAELYQEMDDIIEKIASGTATDEDVEKYNSIWNVFADSTNDSMKQMEELIAQGATLDFSDPQKGVEDALAYLDSVAAMADDAKKTFDDALKATEESIKFKKDFTQKLFDNKLIDEATYNKRMSLYDQILGAVTESTEKQKSEAEDKIQEAYDLLFRTAFAGNTGTQAYWDEIIKPLIEKAAAAGYKVPEEFVNAIKEHFENHELEVNTDGIDLVIDKNKGKTAKEVADAIQEQIREDLTAEKGLLQKILYDAGVLKTTDDSVWYVSDLAGIKSFELLSDYKKRLIADKVREYFGEDGELANNVLKELGYDFDLDLIENVDDLFDDSIFWNPEVEVAPVFTTKDPEILAGVTNAINYVLKNGKLDVQTLESIGKQYGLTLEEVLGYVDQSVFDDSLKEDLESLFNGSALNTEGVQSATEIAAASVEGMASRIISAFASLDGLSYEMDVNGVKYSGAMSVLLPSVQQKATGGFVKSGDLVMANENGNFEMMGRMGNQPVVANNQQIVAGITSGVSQANEGVESRLTVIEGLLTRILSKEFVAKAVPSASWGNFNNRSNNEYGKVTGV